MQVVAYKSEAVTVRSHELFALLDAALPPQLAERCVIAVSSKVVALCEGRAVPIQGTDKDALIHQQATKYLPRSFSRYDVNFTITHNILTPTAGIDESNGNGNYVLWPQDPQASANAVRQHLRDHFGVQEVGVVITDSALRPLRWGVTGIAVASSGFEAVEDSIGQPDIFGRPLQVTKSSIQDSLAAAAALVMGEGAQQTPFAVISDIPFVTFVPHDPTPEELAAQHIAPEDDLYAPFLTAVTWQTGEGQQK